VELVQQVAPFLAKHIKGYFLQESFGAGTSELFFNFGNRSSSFGLRLVWAGRTCLLFFRQNGSFDAPIPHQPRFKSLAGLMVTDVRVHEKNRSFEINFSDGSLLFFKMYDGLSNVLLFRNGEWVEHFRQSIHSDSAKSYAGMLPADSRACSPPALRDGSLAGDLNQANGKWLAAYTLAHTRNELATKLDTKLKRLNASLQKTQAGLNKMRSGVPPEEIGHIIMASMHAIRPGETSAELFDLYRNETRVVSLKKDLSPQENAAWYYRKAKHRKQQEQDLDEKIARMENEIKTLKAEREQLEQATDLRSLKPFMAAGKAQEKAAIPFREFIVDGFTIWAGRSSANNDLLTMKYSHKADLWLHAKGSSGSHVVVKHRSGYEFTKTIVEKAASIAAYFSKQKGSSLVPVSYTLRKFVRKPKGAAVGAVMLEREEVVLVSPGLPGPA
jgi:predicted ribosome quality control (RQC) complex YloA/Tae2 family protein